ncbi:MAG: HlyD family efflux transporter periplasmic adaptor subunit [Planctomycetales bacterium]|nr:HlyD family efflux transporter periplasmic adaptor subunit [Planctomycetales bacterium]
MIKNILFGAIIPFLLVAVGVGVMIGMKRPVPGKKPPIEDNRAALLTQILAADVQTVRALAEVSEILEIPVSGTVVPFREIQLAAEVAGRITEKNPNTRSGNFVEEGSELYRIDPRDYELEVERVTRRLDQERASLAEQQQDIDNALRLVDVAEQEMLLAEAEVERFERLGGNFRSEAELDAAKRARLSSMNQRVTIQNQVSLLRARRARLESAVKLAETELEQAQLNLQRTVVRAPVSGRVVTEQVEADSYVQRGTPLVTIEDTSSVEVAVNVRMDQLYWILDQQHLSSDSLVNAAQASHYQLPRNEVKVIYQLSGRESARYEWKGVLARYDGAGIDPQSRTVPIRVLVDKPGEYLINGQPARESSMSGPSSLVRGMFVEAVIEAKPATPLLLVPKLSVKPATGSNQIWKFTANPQALVQTRQSLKAAGILAEPDRKPVQGVDASSQSPTLDDPDAWEAGFLSVIDGVAVVGPYLGPAPVEDRPVEDKSVGSPSNGVGNRADPIEYWVCEVASGELVAGDKVVVTPLPGIEAEGDEPIRVRKSQLE